MSTGNLISPLQQLNNPSDVYKTASLTGEQYGQTESAFARAANTLPGTVGASAGHSQSYNTTSNVLGAVENARYTNITGASNQDATAGYTTTTTTTQQRSIVNNSVPQMSSDLEQQYAGQKVITSTTTATGPAQMYTQYRQNQNISGATTGNVSGETRVVREGQPREEHTRKISSIVVEEALVGEVPQDRVSYVHVPVYEEEIEYRTVKEKRVLPSQGGAEIRYVDKKIYNEVPKEVVETRVVPNKLGPIIKEVVRDDPNKPAKVVQQIERDTPYPNFVDHEVPVIVAQMSRPIIREHGEQVEIAARDFQPEIVPVDLHLVRPVENTLQLIGTVKSKHRLVEIGAAQYNTLLKSLNAGVNCELPYVSQNGRIEYVPEHELKYTLAPRGVEVEGWQPKVALPPPQQTSTIELSSANSMVRSQAANSVTQISRSEQPRFTQSQNVLTSGARGTITVKSGQNITNRLDELTSSAYSASRMLKTRGVESHRSNLQNTDVNASDSSSVSSSINKIASQMQQGRTMKRSYMCCGSGIANQQGASQPLSRISVDLNNPPSQCTYPTISTAQDVVDQAVAGANSAIGRSHHHIQKAPGSRSAGGEVFIPEEGVSQHISVQMTSHNNRQARVC